MRDEIVEIDLDGVISDCARGNFNPAGEHVIRLLVDKLREAEADAKRYRFMRDMSDKIDVSRFFWIDVSERDAEIDDTMNHEWSNESARVEP